MSAEKTKKNKLVKAWVNQHINDPYVQLAKKDGYRSRAAYKLLEIDKTDNLFHKVSRVVDLGCAPGSWSQVAIKKVGKEGLVVGVDLLEMIPIPGVRFIYGDFTEVGALNQLIKEINNEKIDLVLSDMSPNLSGVKSVDQARLAYLVELVLDFASEYLKIGGNCLIKVFHGVEFDNLIKLARESFMEVIVRKPDPSRSKSSETYLLCKNKKS